MRALTQQQVKKLVPVGWHSLIESLYSRKDETLDILDAKEKFGGLRLETGGLNGPMMRLVEEIEHKSEAICQRCGMPGSQFKTESGWIRTLCQKHQRRE